MEQNELLSGMILELRRGTVVLCALCLLDEPKYGYNLQNELSEYGIITEANTLYPLLRRLEAQGLLISEWNTQEAKPRKYYQTTELGKDTCKKLRQKWMTLSDCMGKIVKENDFNDK